MIDLGKGSYSMEKIPDSVKVGYYSSIGSDVDFVEGTHLVEVYQKCVYTTNWSQPPVKRIYIGNDVWIGQGAKILDGVIIGDGAIIGACAVIAKAVAPYSVMIGNPAKVHRYRFSKDQIAKLEKIKWW